jgi:predicted CXXCH cytochrome family protein
MSGNLYLKFLFAAALCIAKPLMADADKSSVIYGQATKGAAAGYVDDKACATCHQQQYDSYQHVGMARSFKRPGEAAPMEDFGKEYFHEPSQRYYRITKQQDGLVFHRYQRDAEGGAINELEIPVDWVMGSGNRARSYLYQTEWGELYLLPVSWYSETGSWGMSPGFEYADQQGIHRRVERQCMFCHNAYPEVPSGSDVHMQVETFPENLPQGTGCQRCHGPGAKHIDAVTGGGDITAIHAAVVNPGRLSSELRDSVCFQCHMLPAASLVGARRFGRAVYSFRPGQDLSDYLVHVDIVERGVDPTDRFEINHHGYRFFQSRCYQESQGELACISCHDPHVKPGSEAFRASTAQVCSGCHETPATLHAAGTELGNDDCVTCHMPTRRTRDVIHVTMTDHRIATGPFDLDELVKPLEQEAGTITGIGILELGEPPAGNDAMVYRMIAALRAGRSVTAARDALAQALTNQDYSDPAPYMHLATAQLQTGQYPAAEATSRKLISQHPKLHVPYTTLGISLMAQGQNDEAIKYLKQSLAIQPDPETHFNLAAGYLRAGDYPKAEQQVDAALGLRPYMAIAWKYKALLLDSKGARLEARDALVRSLELEPLDLSVYQDLIKLMREIGDSREAERYRELAARVAATLAPPAAGR